jgi:hypothetical protein
MTRTLARLNEPQRQIVEALGSLRTTWWTPQDLAALLDREPECTTDDLAELHVAGWVRVDETPDGDVKVALSAVPAPVRIPVLPARPRRREDLAPLAPAAVL